MRRQSAAGCPSRWRRRAGLPVLLALSGRDDAVEILGWKRLTRYLNSLNEVPAIPTLAYVPATPPELGARWNW